MTLKKVKSNIIFLGDKFLSRFQNENPHLLILLFHGLFKNKSEIDLNLVSPLEAVTIEHFEKTINYFLKQRYLFISPDQILSGLDANKKYVILTFDDGYYNNTLSLPILKKYDVPALFFISTYYVINKIGFWWDVLYRNTHKEGITNHDFYQEEKILEKSLDEIKEIIFNKFNVTNFNPISDIDRPFFADELKDFANEKNVYLGNHSDNHTALVSNSYEELKINIRNAQNYLYELIGEYPIAISYPYGKHNYEVAKVAEECGLKLGMTTISQKNFFPLKNLMLLNRYRIYGYKNLEQQLFYLTHSKHLLNYLKNKGGNGC